MLVWFNFVSAIVGFALKAVESKSFLKTFGDVPE